MSPRIRGSVVQLQVTPRTASSDLQSDDGNLRQQRSNIFFQLITPWPNFEATPELTDPTVCGLTAARLWALAVFILIPVWAPPRRNPENRYHTPKCQQTTLGFRFTQRANLSEWSDFSKQGLNIQVSRGWQLPPFFFAGRSELDRMLMFGRVFILSLGKQGGRPVLSTDELGTPN